ncbi:hypothetical protein HRG_004756 [Hirsutella rhossiliensis]|uniref:Uncharacterized protein n=1 Tax=Hirsutella rhossiliensis TaxID=111463 RepID=A0A9P8MXV0_9HYPO|nr:uncharacterized protein HRG_04756 [Hirsutella rhossiliensis]KAH0964328.1 hypothetical protein HRG_04756 [Hirsutella rhossiliensis]
MAAARTLPGLGPKLSSTLPTLSLRLLYTAAPGQGGRTQYRDEAQRDISVDRRQSAKPHGARVATRDNVHGDRAQYRGRVQTDRPEDGRRLVKPYTRNNVQGGRPQQRGGVQRYVAEDARKFVKTSGTLLTTRENVRFLLENDIEPDNARMRPFTSQPEMRKISAEYRAKIAFSSRHVLHPFDMKYFDPKGHPLAAMTRSRYARRKLDEPLWIMFTTRAAGASAVVRGLTQRRLAGALHGALEELGYTLAPGLGARKEIRGTLWISLLDPIATAAKPAQRFGKEVAAALDRECSRRK